MNISLTEFDAQDFNVFDTDFQEQAEQLTVPPDEALYISEQLEGIVLSYDEVLKLLNDGKVTGKLMVYYLNYLQGRSQQITKFFIAVQKTNLDLVDQLNEIIHAKQKAGDPLSYTIILFWQDRWVGGVYFIKTQLLEIIDLQVNKTKDQLKKIFENCLKLTKLAKFSIKSVAYVQQDDKNTDGGLYLLHYLYTTICKVQPFTKMNATEKLQFKNKMLWLLYMSEKSQQIKYPRLPSMNDYKESEIKNFKSPGIEPFLPDQFTGVECKISDLETLQKSGKSSSNMMAFWLSYLYSFDLDRKSPMLPFFVVTEGTEIMEDFEAIFKPRRSKTSHLKLILASMIKNRWVLAIYHMQEKKLEIIDLQHKGITKEELKKLFDVILEKLVDYSNPIATYITQTNTDSSDGTEWYINFLWQYLSGTSLDKIKFGFSEKRQLRNKLIWVLYKMSNDPISLSQSSLRSIKKQVQPGSSTSIQIDQKKQNTKLQKLPTIQQIGSSRSIKQIEDPQQKSGLFRSKKGTVAPSILKGSPSNLKSQMSRDSYTSQEQTHKKKSSFSRQRDKDQSPKSQESDTSITYQKPKFGQNSSIKRQQTKVPKEPILETQRSEEYDEEETKRIFDKKDQIQSQQQSGVFQEGNDNLDRIQKDLTEYYHTLLNEPEQQVEEDKLEEIFRLNNQIQLIMNRRKLKPFEEVLETVKYKSANPNQSQLYQSSLQNYSTILHDDQAMMRMLNDMLSNEDGNESQQKSILKRRNYVVAEISSLDVSQPSFQEYDFPQNKSSSLPALKGNNIRKSELFQKTNLAALRYGYRIEVPMMQQFYKDGRMQVILLNFLLAFLNEKSLHKQNYQHNKYNTRVKIFPTSFYLTLTNSLIHSTFRINYYQANQHTFEHSGEGQTIFDEFDWLIIPVVEFPTEYSIVAVNLKRRACFCYLLSSMAMRIRDPLYINPERNPYMKNVIQFLYYEYELKLKRPRDELGRFSMQFGYANDSNNFSYGIDYNYSGIYAFYIVNHIIKNGYNEEIKIEDYEVQVLRKTLHDLVVRIGYNIDDNLFHLLEDSSWPF